MQESTFWGNYSSNFARPVDHAVRKISPVEVVGFVRGARSVFNIVEGLNPDVIFLPERGANPVDWALQRFSELYRGSDRMKVYLPIGTCVDPQTGQEWGPEKLLKRQVVKRLVEDLRERVGWLNRPLLIDEVQSGATLTNVAHSLVEVLTGKDPSESGESITDRLFVIAIQDSRNGWLTHKKAKGYRSISHNEKANIQAFIEELPLFTVDRQIFLNHLLSPMGVTPDHLRLPMVMQNIAAQKLIKSLVTVVTHPDTLETNLDQYLVRDEYSGRDLQERVDDASIADWYKEIAKISRIG